MRLRLRRKGFTLVELIVVIAIIGVLAAIIAPTAIHFVEEGKVEAAQSDCKTILNSIEVNVAQLAVGGAFVVDSEVIANLLNTYLNGEPADGTYVSIVEDSETNTYTATVVSPQELDGEHITAQGTYNLPNTFTVEECTVTFNDGTWA